MTSTETTWPWQRLNEGNASSHGILTRLLDPRRGERWLDVGTGGGGLALLLARAGAVVVAIDVAEDGLEHAREAARAEGLEVDFRLADAQELLFEDETFDGVASAFGVIFAPEHERAAAELARVCRPGGKLGLTLMPMDSRTGQTFSVLERYGGAPSHPAAWSENVERLLGGSFELEVAPRESPDPPRPAPSWEESLRSFAPLRHVVDRLHEREVAELRRELDDVAERYRERQPSYVIVLGRRR